MSDGLESARAATRPYTDRIWRRQEATIKELQDKVARLTEERDALIEPMQRFTHELSMALDWKGPDVPSLAELVTAVRTALAAKDEALSEIRNRAESLKRLTNDDSADNGIERVARAALGESGEAG